MEPIGDDILQCIADTAWLRVSDNRLMTGDQVQPSRGLALSGITYGWGDLELLNRGDRISPAGSAEILPTELRARRAGWIVDRFLAVRPLVFYTVFGDRPMFELARLSLRSLRLFAGVELTAALITRPQDGATAGSVCPGNGDGFDLVRWFEAGSLDEFAFARYRAMPAMPDLHWHNYCPVIYLDSDMICDGSLQRMCIEARRSERMMVAPEGPMFRSKGDWYGAGLLAADGSLRLNEDEPGFSTGLLVAPDSDAFAEFGARVCDIRQRLAREATALLNFFDQPIANYVARKMGGVDWHSLRRSVRLVGHHNEPSLGDCRGLAHFAGGVGNHGPKLPRMRAYLDRLEARKECVQ
jgi:hypothetical protein